MSDKSYREHLKEWETREANLRTDGVNLSKSIQPEPEPVQKRKYTKRKPKPSYGRKFTPNQIRLIRKSLMPASEEAKYWKVAKSTILKIRRKERYKEVL